MDPVSPNSQTSQLFNEFINPEVYSLNQNASNSEAESVDKGTDPMDVSTASVIRDVQEAAQKLQEAAQKLEEDRKRLEEDRKLLQNTLQESTSLLEENLQNLEEEREQLIKERSELERDRLRAQKVTEIDKTNEINQLQNDRQKLIEYIEKLKIYIGRLITCINIESDGPPGVQPDLPKLQQDIKQLKQDIRQLKELAIATSPVSEHVNPMMLQLQNDRQEIIHYLINLEQYTEGLIRYIVNKHLQKDQPSAQNFQSSDQPDIPPNLPVVERSDPNNLQLQKDIEQLESDKQSLQIYINVLLEKNRQQPKNTASSTQTEKLKEENDNLKSDNEKLKEENAQLKLDNKKLNKNIGKLRQEMRSIKERSNQNDSFEIPSNNIETLINSIKYISEDQKISLKESLKKDFPLMNSYDCKSLESTLEQVVENINLKERYENAQVYSKKQKKNVNCFNLNKLSDDIKNNPTSWIKEDLRWVLRVFNLLLDNPLTQPSREMGRAKHCCLAWLLSDISTWEEDNLNTKVADFCDKSYPKDSEGNPLPESEIPSFIHKKGSQKFVKPAKKQHVWLLESNPNIKIINFKNFLIATVDQYRIRLASYVNLSKRIDSVENNDCESIPPFIIYDPDNINFKNNTITSQGLRKLLEDSFDKKITVMSGNKGFKGERSYDMPTRFAEKNSKYPPIYKIA